MSTIAKRGLLLLLFVSGVGCTVSDVDQPPLTGPSGFALRIQLQAIPDSILQDGASQAVVNVEATGADGRPLRGLVLRVDQIVDGQLFDFGTVSAKTIVTGDDGRARVIYTSPPRDNGLGHVVTLVFTPIGSDFGSEAPRTVNIELVPIGVIRPPNPAPVPTFTFSPTAPNVLDTVIFDASGTTDGDQPCPTCTFHWDFGDGSTATGVFASHQFRTVGNFAVRLTVTDSMGEATQTVRSITVGQGAPPTGTFAFSPATPAVNEPVLFNAAAVQAAPGRRIVSYEWNFGNGRTGSGVTTSTTYQTAGSFPVTLTVTDDAGTRQTIGPVNVLVSLTGTLDANLIVSPGGGTTSTNFFFDASSSRPGPSPIVEYRFNFGDNTPEVVGTSPSTTHRYSTPGTYTARVTVRDSAGRTDTQTVSVAVQ